MTKEEREATMRAEAADPMLVIGVDYAAGADRTEVARVLQCHGHVVLEGGKCPECRCQP